MYLLASAKCSIHAFDFVEVEDFYPYINVAHSVFILLPPVLIVSFTLSVYVWKQHKQQLRRSETKRER